jgi:hypothetical protein
MPGLLRGIARAVVIAGTASPVSGRVQHRQAAWFADCDAQIAADRQRAYRQRVAPPPEVPPPPVADAVQQLQQLARYKAQGILTDAEFAGLQARVLGT